MMKRKKQGTHEETRDSPHKEHGFIRLLSKNVSRYRTAPYTLLAALEALNQPNQELVSEFTASRI